MKNDDLQDTKVRNDASGQETRDFYASDLGRRVQGRLRENPRISRATAFMVPKIPVNAKVLEIGCGIGILTERIARRVRHGAVVAVDISPENVDYCQKTISAQNIRFVCADILESFDEIGRFFEEDVDVVIASDVIEHLPQKKSIALFRNISSVLKPEGRILLTYPSPEYQKYLYREPGSRLQPIDLVIELKDMLSYAEAAGCTLRTFTYKDIWMRNQYIHCELIRSLKVSACREGIDDQTGPWQQNWQWFRKKSKGLWNILLAPIRYRKYVVIPRKKVE